MCSVTYHIGREEKTPIGCNANYCRVFWCFSRFPKHHRNRDDTRALPTPVAPIHTRADNRGRIHVEPQARAPTLPSEWRGMCTDRRSEEAGNDCNADNGHRTTDLVFEKSGLVSQNMSERDKHAITPSSPRRPLPPIGSYFYPRPAASGPSTVDHLRLPSYDADPSKMGAQDDVSKGRTLRGSWNKLTRSLREPFSRSQETIPTAQLCKEPLRIFVGTWNMNARMPRGDISSFLGDARDPSIIPPFSGCHILVIGTQECEERLETAGFRQPKEKEKWLGLIKLLIGPGYALICTRTLVGLHLAVFVMQRCRRHLTDVSSADAKVYLNGAKGAVGIAFHFLGRSFCFINAHLKAHEGSVERRNADWNKINETLQLPSYEIANYGGMGVVQRFDYVFWMGDLNYRTNLGLNKTALAKSLLAKPDVDLGIFLSNDELRKAYDAKLIFPGFSEGPITFKPTFKYDVPSTVSPTSPTSPRYPEACSIPENHQMVIPGYDSSAKQRMPSYTDRILYRTRLPSAIGERVYEYMTLQSQGDIKAIGESINHRVTVEKYTDCPAIIDSDHKPVYGIYRLAEEVISIQDKDEIQHPTPTATAATRRWQCIRRKRRITRVRPE